MKVLREVVKNIDLEVFGLSRVYGASTSRKIAKRKENASKDMLRMPVSWDVRIGAKKFYVVLEQGHKIPNHYSMINSLVVLCL